MVSILFGHQLPLYAAYSHFRLSPSAGSRITMAYWICFTLSRSAAIFVSTRVPARRTIYLYLALYLVPCTWVVCRGEMLTYEELLACAVVIAIGGGPLLSTGIMIYEEFVVITEQVLCVYIPIGIL